MSIVSCGNHGTWSVQLIVCECWYLFALSDWLSWSCWCPKCQFVSGYCALLCLKPADDACPMLSSMWVAAVPCCVSSLLMIPVLCSPGCEWLLCICCVSSLLMMPVLCSPVCEWLLYFAVSQACQWYLSSALQFVSGCCALLCLKSANDACPLLSSLWVAAVPCCVSSLLMMPVL